MFNKIFRKKCSQKKTNHLEISAPLPQAVTNENMSTIERPPTPTIYDQAITLLKKIEATETRNRHLDTGYIAALKQLKKSIIWIAEGGDCATEANLQGIIATYIDSLDKIKEDLDAAHAAAKKVLLAPVVEMITMPEVSEGERRDSVTD